MTNFEMARGLLRQLSDLGVTELCLCAGARNAPIVSALAEFDFKIYSFFDERSASFFALGRARALGHPVVVTTTSGSAVAELLPACVEAFYSKTPLLLLTADRPKSYRGSGSPQAIEQLTMLEAHVERQYDLESQLEVIELGGGPVQVNVCFDEPLLGGEIVANRQTKQDVAKKNNTRLEAKAGSNPLVIVSGLAPRQAQWLRPLLRSAGHMCILEATSQLQGHPDLRGLEIPSWRIRAESFEEYFDSVIRIGGVPTLRLFRDLDQSLQHVPVVHFSQLPWLGLARDLMQGRGVVRPLEEAKEFLRSPKHGSAASTLLLGADEVISCLRAYPLSELNLVQILKSQIPNGSQVFLGNSLPIREWDSVPSEFDQTETRILAQRGVNGIDGLISHFLGACLEGIENVLILGDLSFMYDTSGLWALDQLPDQLKCKIFVINNSGGRIFRRLFDLPLLEMSHRSELKPLGQAWGVPHVLLPGSQMENFQFQRLPRKCVIEIRPNLEQSDQAWDSLRKLYV